MSKARLVTESLKGNRNILTENLNESRAKLLQEVLITLNQKSNDNKFGNVVILAGGAGCYPYDTEFFTGNGWKKISDYQPGDKVLQFNVDTEKATLTSSVDFVKLPIDNFYRIKNRRVDFITSENHKHLIRTEKGNLITKSTSEIINITNSTSRGVRGELVTSFDYEGGSGLDLTDDQIRLKVAIYADGYILGKTANGDYKVRLSFKKDRKIQRFKELASRLNLDFREYLENGFTRFVFKHDSDEKEFESYWYNCNKHQFEVIANEVMHWDGHVSKREGRKDGLGEYGSISKKSVDFIQFVFASLGKNTTFRLDERPYRDNYTTAYGVGISYSKGKGISKNSKSVGKTTQVDNVTSAIDNDGFMYCFTTETGFFVVRQNNQIYVSGNSGKGFVLSNMLDIQGKVFDVDALKSFMINSTQLADKIKKEKDIDVKTLNLKNPQDVSRLHMLAKEVGLERIVKDTMYKSIYLADPDRKPNLIFDVTLKSPDALVEISEQIAHLNYDKKKIHIVWVVNDVQVAIEQNEKRSRSVSSDILLATHSGVASTIKILLHPLFKIRNYADGKVVFAFNKAKVDSEIASTDKKASNVFKNKTAQGFYIKEADYVVIKEVGQEPKDLDKINSYLLQKIVSYIPDSVKAMWDFELQKSYHYYG